MSDADSVTVSIEIAVPPAVAFAVFTEDLDAWWQRGPRYRFRPPYEGVLRLEGGVGGRLLHLRFTHDTDPFVVGRVRVWEPPARLAFSWRLPNFAPHQTTEVEIRFDAVTEGTRVTLTHRGWDSVPSDHPARHGQMGRAFVLFKGHWWAGVLGAVRRHAEVIRSAVDMEGDRS
jgi:uncharacterized protein YndB with AHSA1/START domain